uniref:Uncharacterized protein n=1 Tax=Oryza punctata TaxID=4537 RepID=A0A0E0LDA2_ORYPU
MTRLPSPPCTCSSPCDGEPGPLLPSSSSIICSAILSSSSIVAVGGDGEPVVDVDVVVTVLSLGVGWSLDDAAVDAAATDDDTAAVSLLSSTVMTQLESARAPARFCQTPMCDFSGSRRRQVSDGDGVLQHFRSLALRICDKLFPPPWAVIEDELPPPRPSRAATAAAGASSPVAFLETGKLVLALRPLIKMAASSYARAASSAVSKVQTLKLGQCVLHYYSRNGLDGARVTKGCLLFVSLADCKVNGGAKAELGGYGYRKRMTMIRSATPLSETKSKRDAAVEGSNVRTNV